MSKPEPTYRKLLESYTATDEEITRAQRMLVQSAHPDPKTIAARGSLETEIRVCEAHKDGLALLLLSTPAKVLDTPPTADHMKTLIKIARARDLLLGTMSRIKH